MFYNFFFEFWRCLTYSVWNTSNSEEKLNLNSCVIRTLNITEWRCSVVKLLAARFCVPFGPSVCSVELCSESQGEYYIRFRHWMLFLMSKQFGLPNRGFGGICGVRSVRSVENDECGRWGVWRIRSVNNGGQNFAWTDKTTCTHLDRKTVHSFAREHLHLKSQNVQTEGINLNIEFKGPKHFL